MTAADAQPARAGLRTWALGVACFAAGALFNRACQRAHSPAGPFEAWGRFLLEASPAAPTADASPRDTVCGEHGMLWGGERECTCHACAQGSHCESTSAARRRDASCVIDVRAGQPTLFEDYWLRARARRTCVSAEHSLEYALSGEAMPRLLAAIRAVHALVGNARLDANVSIIVGVGSLSLLQAAMTATATWAGPAAAGPTHVWAPSPYLSYIADACRSHGRLLNCSRLGQREPPRRQEFAMPDGRWLPLVEVVTSPNNPDGRLQRSRLSGPNVVVHDHAYYWPHFTPVAEPIVVSRPEHVALFTMSKLSGHASSRVGWAIVRRGSMLEKSLRAYVARTTVGVPRDAQHRAAAALEEMVADGGQLLRWAQQAMAERWRVLDEVFAPGAPVPSAGGVFKLHAREPAQRDLFLRRTTSPTPAFVWLERVDGGSAFKALASVGIIARSGRAYGAGANFARLSLIMRATEFELLVQKLRNLGHQ